MREVATPEIGPQDALVRGRNISVCGAGLKIRAGRMGLDVLTLIMGHEGAGEAAAVGDDMPGFAPGDRVVVAFYVTGGRCRYCREGRDTLCDDGRQHGFSRDVGMADYMKTPAANL